MAKDLNATGRWLKKIAQGFVGEPQDRTELVALLRQASQRGLVDADALSMLEGVLEVGDLQVRQAGRALLETSAGGGRVRTLALPGDG
jgi:Mg2+/Co2+ transporter CorC